MAICVDREKCIGCESCIAVCPVGALNMVDGKANIDQDTCIACGACIGECPVEAIEREEIVREVKNKEGKNCQLLFELFFIFLLLTLQSPRRLRFPRWSGSRML